ncbi:MAG TPA: histidine phosphatase family protein [Saprospiraceae bacterium]|nr:histidine phosphatase family protein [Saprospiraceae bacterium]
MKKIYLVRHAKSSWEYSGINDHERPLNHRGEQDAPIMATRIMEQFEVPQLLITSSAKRAFDTATLFSKVFNTPSEHFKVEKNLYHADIEDLMSCINGIDDQYDHVCLFAHNPGITYFANIVCEANIHDIATAGILIMEANVSSWHNIEAHDITLISYIYPKMED